MLHGRENGHLNAKYIGPKCISITGTPESRLRSTFERHRWRPSDRSRRDCRTRDRRCLRSRRRRSRSRFGRHRPRSPSAAKTPSGSMSSTRRSPALISSTPPSPQIHGSLILMWPSVPISSIWSRRDMSKPMSNCDNTRARMTRRGRNPHLDVGAVVEPDGVDQLGQTCEEPYGAHAVTTQVAQCTTTEFTGTADVVRRDRHRQCCTHTPQRANLTVGDKLAGQAGLRVPAPHQAFHAQPISRVGGVEVGRDLPRVDGERLLAQRVLARPQRLDGPLGVLGDRQRDVDASTSAIIQQGLITAVTAGDAILVARTSGTGPRIDSRRRRTGPVAPPRPSPQRSGPSPSSPIGRLSPFQRR